MTKYPSPIKSSGPGPNPPKYGQKCDFKSKFGLSHTGLLVVAQWIVSRSKLFMVVGQFVCSESNVQITQSHTANPCGP